MNEIIEPRLAPPGAGLPTPELYVARLLFAFRRLRGNRAKFSAKFAEERRAIETLVRSCDTESAARRVLIPRPRGLEDSSRYWSVWMTLDHLRIVNHGIAGIIGQLANGKIPPGQGSTARVKPSPEVGGSVVAEYETGCDELLNTVAAVHELKTPARYAHPWFGPLDALGWYALAGGHTGLHRVQIELILKRLGAIAK